MKHTCVMDNTCTCCIVAMEPDEYCPKHGGAIKWPPKCAICGRFLSVPALRLGKNEALVEAT